MRIGNEEVNLCDQQTVSKLMVTSTLIWPNFVKTFPEARFPNYQKIPAGAKLAQPQIYLKLQHAKLTAIYFLPLKIAKLTLIG